MLKKTIIIVNTLIIIVICASCTVNSYNLSEEQNVSCDPEKFIEYIKQGDLYNVKLCLDAGADPNTKDNSGRTVLFFGVKNGHPDVVKLLLQKGADPNAIINDGTILEYAISGLNHYIDTNNNKYYKIIEMLLNNNADVNYQDKFSKENSLFLAVNGGQVDVVKLLITCGADINAKNKFGENALMKAAFYGYSDIVKLLLENGVNINEIDNYGTTALMFATSKGHTNVVTILLDYGADINLKDNYGTTALIKTPANKPEIIRLLEGRDR